MSGIIVGIDGSSHSARALEWALNEAANRHAPLTVLTVHSVAVSGRYGGGQAGALAHVGYLGGVQDQHARHAVQPRGELTPCIDAISERHGNLRWQAFARPAWPPGTIVTF